MLISYSSDQLKTDGKKISALKINFIRTSPIICAQNDQLIGLSRLFSCHKFVQQENDKLQFVIWEVCCFRHHFDKVLMN